MFPDLNLKMRCFCLLLACLAVAGCSDGKDLQKVEFASSTVQRALESWKQGAKPVDLRSAADPVDFHDDDWDRSAKLVDFEIRQTYMESDGTARCAVSLTVQYGKKVPVKVKCTYQIVTEPEVIIGRDPMS